VNEDTIRNQVKVQRKRMTEDPWIDPPINVVVPMRKINGWELATSQRDPNQKFTPPLPDLAAGSVATDTESVALVPYGATHLRLTVFPQIT